MMFRSCCCSSGTFVGVCGSSVDSDGSGCGGSGAVVALVWMVALLCYR